MEVVATQGLVARNVVSRFGDTYAHIGSETRACKKCLIGFNTFFFSLYVRQGSSVGLARMIHGTFLHGDGPPEIYNI